MLEIRTIPRPDAAAWQAFLDEYLPEIERTWRFFVELASPVQVRRIRLRYINRILLPLASGGVRESRSHQIWQRCERADQNVGFVNYLHVAKPRKNLAIDEFQ